MNYSLNLPEVHALYERTARRSASTTFDVGDGMVRLSPQGRFRTLGSGLNATLVYTSPNIDAFRHLAISSDTPIAEPLAISNDNEVLDSRCSNAPRPPQ
jgi:hypothetical protein